MLPGGDAGHTALATDHKEGTTASTLQATLLPLLELSFLAVGPSSLVRVTVR